MRMPVSCTRTALLLGLSFFLFCAPESRGQSITAGDVTGTVTDPSGAAVPNAAVTLTSVDTNTSRTAATNAEGSYRFAFVPPGLWKIAVNASGFQAQEHPNLTVTAGQPTAVNVQLALAKSSQTVDVVETATAIQTENADVGTTFNREMIRDLP